jgi:hypothetical protein
MVGGNSAAPILLTPRLRRSWRKLYYNFKTLQREKQPCKKSS